MYKVGEVIVMCDNAHDIGIITGKADGKCYCVDFSGMNNIRRTSSRAEIHPSWFKQLDEGEEV